MHEPKSWTLDELRRDAEAAKDLFRRSRLDEPLALYSEFFDAFAPVFAELIDQLSSLASATFDPSDLAELVGTPDAKTAFRYLAAPPVSEDDLRTLAPEPGEFCGESKLGDTRADLVIRLHDGRAMPVECKTSNSAVNSFKRINHEAVGKARLWLDAFGKRGIVPCAVIGGVFNPMNLQSAQQEGRTIIWSHRLADLASFIAAAR